MAEQRASRKTDRNRNGCRVALVDFRPRASSTAKRQRQAARVQLGPIVGDAHPHRHCTERGRALLLFTHMHLDEIVRLQAQVRRLLRQQLWQSAALLGGALRVCRPAPPPPAGHPPPSH